MNAIQTVSPMAGGRAPPPRQVVRRAERHGRALATMGEIAQGHGDIRTAVRSRHRSPLERLLAARWDEVDDAATLRTRSAN